MKRLALLAALIIGSAASSFAAVGTVMLNNYDADKAVFLDTAGTKAPMDSVFFELLGNGALVQNTTDGSTKWSINAEAGYFDTGVGIVPGVAANATGVNFELRGYVGASWATGTKIGSITWTQAVGSWDNTAQPPAPPSGAALALPGNLLVKTAIPEPSTIALGLLGAAALLIRRRK